MESNAIEVGRQVLPPAPTAGLLRGAVGVLAFSFTVPLTRIAVGGLSPLFTGSGRAVVAAVLAGLALTATRAVRPTPRQGLRLAVVAAGVVAGFPLLTSFALRSTPAVHGAVVIALLPAATAVTVVLRTRERPPTAFWVTAALGALAAVGFATLQGGGPGAVHRADLLLFAAVGAAAFGYLAVVSTFLGFFAWYRGLSIGPMTRVSQVQLVQPVLTITWAALLLGEPLPATTVVGGLLVIGSAALAVRSRTRS